MLNNHNNRPRRFSVLTCSFSFFIFSFSFLLSGCGSPLWTHGAPGDVNARLLGDQLWDEPSHNRPDADIVLVASFVSSSPYRTTTSGFWQETWHYTTWNVDRVTKGSWPNPQLAFVYYDRSPTPDSGITAMLAPTPYRPGATIRFYLQQTWGVPTILAHEPLNTDHPHPPPARNQN